MVSSFSNPGFPPVHTHPPTFSAMVAANADLIRETVDAIFAPYLAKIRRARELALGTEGDSTPTPMIAISDGGDSDPASMCSEEAELIEVGHQKPQNGDGIPLCIPSTIHDHSIPPLLSSSPLLRALATPAVRPQSNDYVAATVSLLGNEFAASTHLLKIGAEFMQAQPSMIANKCQKELVGMSARYVFDEIPDSSCCAVLDRDMCYCKGIQDKGGGSKFRSLEDCRMKLVEKIARLEYDDNIDYFIKKKLHVWCQLPNGLLELGMICRHEVLRSLIYNFKNRKAMWHWFFHGFLACYIDGKMVMTDVYLNEINGWIGMYEVGKFVMVLNAEKVFEEMPKRECENIRGTYFEFIFSLKDHREINFGALAIYLHADFSVLFISNFRPVWDPGDALAQVVKLMLYLQYKEGMRMGNKQSCFCLRQCGGDWHHAAMPSLVSWVVVRWVRTWEQLHAYQYKFQNDKREKHMDNLFNVHNDKGEKHMNNPFDIQRLLQKLVVSWYIRYCYFAQLPKSMTFWMNWEILVHDNVAACSKSMTFWMNWEILLSAIWVLSAASPALFIVRQVDGSVQLMFGNRETLLYEIERYKESTSNEQLGCLAIQLHCSEFNLGTNNEINWAQEQKGACVIVALFLIVGTNVSLVQESSLLQHMVATLGVLNSFKSLRWMHQLQTTESKLMDQESETHNRPPSSVNLSVSVWGDVDGMEVVILREESYLALGQANEEDGQLHQAQPVRLLLHGAISGALYAGHIHSLLQRKCITESFLRGLSWLLRFIDKWIHSMDLENHKLNPGIEHYGCIVDLLSLANLLNVAEKFIRDMPTQPDVVIWGSLLFTCRIYGNIELAELVDKRTEVFEPQGAYVNSPRDAGSPLIWDVGHGHQDAVEVPLQNNANLVAENNDSITPLQSSVLVGSLPCLELLVHINHPNMRITPWEVILILGQWVSDIKKDTKMPVYCALIKLLQDKDLSVRLAAWRSLCLHSEDASFFSEREFINLLPICWDSCLKLIKEVQELDSKKAWDESANECLLQIQLLVAWRTAANWEDFHNSIFKP